MASRFMIDSHVHLWPQETANEDGHKWMTPGMPLAKPHLLSDYYKAMRKTDDGHADTSLEGFVYVETDVRYESCSGDVATWAQGPLEEIAFTRSVAEEIKDAGDRVVSFGIVPWAPMDQSTAVLEEYLRLGEEKAGPATWNQIKGFRFLLQSIEEKDSFQSLVWSDHFISNLKLLGQRHFSFDVGVDQHRCGAWQLEMITRAMEMAHDGVSPEDQVVFVVNHLCKPDFSQDDAVFQQWSDAISAMSKVSKTYMKLSGAFSELPEELRETSEIAKHIRPWIKQVFQTFGPSRVMFGSDWPVCNVAGPLGERSWIAWKDVVDHVLRDETYGLTSEDKDHIWHRTAKEAYRMV